MSGLGTRSQSEAVSSIAVSSHLPRVRHQKSLHLSNSKLSWGKTTAQRKAGQRMPLQTFQLPSPRVFIDTKVLERRDGKTRESSEGTKNV